MSLQQGATVDISACVQIHLQSIFTLSAGFKSVTAEHTKEGFSQNFSFLKAGTVGLFLLCVVTASSWIIRSVVRTDTTTPFTKTCSAVIFLLRLCVCECVRLWEVSSQTLTSPVMSIQSKAGTLRAAEKHYGN